MMLAKQRQQYLQSQVQNASKEKLVLMLYDGVLRFSLQGKKALEDSDLVAAHEGLMRAEEILFELIYALDREKGGQLADNLARLYGYCCQCLVLANLQHIPSKVDEAVKVIRELREAWAKAMEQLSGGQTPSAEAAGPAAESAGPAADVVAAKSATPVPGVPPRPVLKPLPAAPAAAPVGRNPAAPIRLFKPPTAAEAAAMPRLSVQG